MKGNQVISVLILPLLSWKLYIIFFLCQSSPTKNGPYPKLNQSQLRVDSDADGRFLIIDRKIGVANEAAHLEVELFLVLCTL